MTVRRGLQVIYQNTLDACAFRFDIIRNTLYSIVGFPYTEKCSNKSGKFCIKNYNTGKSPITVLKIISNALHGNIVIRFDTKFNGNRSSCVIAELAYKSL